MTLNVDWEKMQGLVPAVIQHALSGALLMLGYMNPEALAETETTGRVTFFSRSKQRLWVKGEESGHFLEARSIALDCDRDTLLILAEPRGPVCHLGTPTCFGGAPPRSRAEHLSFLGELEALVADRMEKRPDESYVARLSAQGTHRIAQKVAEEGVELALAAVTEPNDKIVAEAADLLFHAVVLLKQKGLSLTDVVGELERRHRAKA